MSEDNKDLDNLLDDALADFEKTAAKKKSQEKDTANGKTNSTANASADFHDNSDEFFLEQAKQLAERMNTVFGGTSESGVGNEPPLPDTTEQLMAGFKKMAEAAALSLEGKNTASDAEVAKYSDSIAQALKGLQEGADNLTSPVNSNDVASMFSDLNLEGGGDGDNVFLPFMEGMMQSLLSAEILLPSIKELLEKYPKYLEEYSGKIEAADEERYKKQYELYKVIEAHLEQENADDDAAVKREKFKRVLDDMRKLQEYGQPPAEILAETTGDLPLLDPTAGADAFLGGAGGGPQCPTQ